MKHLKKGLLILLAIVAFNNVNAQDEDNPWAIEIGTNAVDFYPTGADFNPLGDGTKFLGDPFDEFFNYEDHYNMSTVISRLRVGHYIGKGFSIGLAGSFNRIDWIGDFPTNKLTYFSGDFGIRYNFIQHKWYDPYLMIGGGYTWLDEEGNGTFNGGLGINFWFNDNFGINVESKYKHSFDSDIMLPHFQHALGVVFKFGGTDTDGDGIYDKYDECPEEAGLEEFNGCPDTDGDGIKDSEDECPNEAGLPELNGCPDSDGDGVADKDDRCPDVAGLPELQGCPDADGDGVADIDDECPQVAGPAENKGCPWPDTDGDGVLDKDDECPDVAGPVENKGCPIVTVEIQKEITDLARAVYFKTGSTNFTDEAAIRMEKISTILNQYKTIKFDVEGHTDSQGSAAFNKKLSQKRADAVMKYVVDHGFPAENIKAIGYGEEKPIGNNKTSKGRQENRRVEIFSEDAKRD